MFECRLLNMYSQHWLIQPLVIQPTHFDHFLWHTQLTPHVKSNPKSMPNTTEIFRVFLVELSGADCNQTST